MPDTPKWILEEAEKRFPESTDSYGRKGYYGFIAGAMYADPCGFARYLDDLKINADKHFNIPKSATTEQLYQEFLIYKSKQK